MSFFDKMFKENKIDKAMDKAFEEFRDNNRVTKKAKATIEEAAERITESLEREVYGEVKERPDGYPSVIENFDSISEEWDDMFNKIVDRELGKFKICPSCGEAVSSELEKCPHCGTSVSDVAPVSQDFLIIDQ